jgi:hypothetical protein
MPAFNCLSEDEVADAYLYLTLCPSHRQGACRGGPMSRAAMVVIVVRPVRTRMVMPRVAMRKSRVFALIFSIVAAGAAWAQVVTPVEIKDPDLRSLQQQFMNDLKIVGQDIQALEFQYHFYLSRTLDLDESQQKHADQSSIRFDRYNGQTVLTVTGNYYAAYPADRISAERRARSTFLSVVMPILKSEVPRFQSNHQVQGYAVEVSHHVLGKVMGVPVERPENLMVFLPQSGAIKLLGSKDENAQQAGLMQGQVFLNAQPITIWLNAEGPRPGAGALSTPTSAESQPPRDGGGDRAGARESSVAQTAMSPSAAPVAKPYQVAPDPWRDRSPKALADLQVSSREQLAKLVKELDPQAHFVSYTSPGFVAFRQGIYLELSISTDLPESAAGSRYKLAALAFDDHVAHLLRPTLAYFKEEPEFDGISFSTSIHLAGKVAAAGRSEAVEFFFPFAALRCYEKYDCTGQQLIDTGTVLINGERVALDLQIAEGGPSR